MVANFKIVLNQNNVLKNVCKPYLSVSFVPSFLLLFQLPINQLFHHIPLQSLIPEPHTHLLAQTQNQFYVAFSRHTREERALPHVILLPTCFPL
jgi:hypothetical protein